MSLVFTSGGFDAAAYARGLAVISESSPDALMRVEGLPAGWMSAIPSSMADASVEADLIVIVSGSPRRADPGSDIATTRVVSARDIAAAWRTGGASSLAALSSNFALVIAEPASGKVHGYRDPAGQSSLFCAGQADSAVFSTELLAVVAVRGEAVLDPTALHDVINMRFQAGRRAIWTGIRQILPGTLLTLDGRSEPSETRIRTVRFEPSASSDTVPTAASRVLTMLEAAFAHRRDEGMDRVAVPLSGGVDSSILAALAVRKFPHVTAYTASIEGFGNPELGRAAEVASRLGLRHQIVQVTRADVARLYPHVIGRLQEPPRHFNNLVIARLMEAMCADCEWIVSGDTADLLFGSGDLNTIHHQASKRHVIGALPNPLQRMLSRSLAHMPGRRSASLARIAGSSLDELVQAHFVVPRSPQGSACVRAFVLDMKPSAELVAAHYEVGHSPFESFQTWESRTSTTATYRRALRLSRARGLCYWYPFRDPAVVEFAIRMPSAMKFDASRSLSKPVLRLVCDKLLGPDVSTWSKLGFPSPEREWMTGPLAAQLDACRASSSAIGAFVDTGAVRRLDIGRDHQLLWTLMTLESVLESARYATTGR